MAETRWTAISDCPASSLGRTASPNSSGALHPRRGARNFSPRSAAATFHPDFPLFQPAEARGKSPKGLPYPRAVSLERNHPAFADQHMARLARSPGIADAASPADSYGFAPGDRTRPLTATALLPRRDGGPLRIARSAPSNTGLLVAGIIYSTMYSVQASRRPQI